MKKFIAGFLCCAVLYSLFAVIPNAIAYTPIKLIINGRTIECDVPPQNINGRVLVPARFVAEELGATVSWDSANNAVIVSSTGGGSIPTASNADHDAWLAKANDLMQQTDTIATEFKANVADESIPLLDLSLMTNDQSLALNKIYYKAETLNPPTGKEQANENLLEYIKCLKQSLYYYAMYAIDHSSNNLFEAKAYNDTSISFAERAMAQRNAYIANR